MSKHTVVEICIYRQSSSSRERCRRLVCKDQLNPAQLLLSSFHYNVANQPGALFKHHYRRRAEA